MTSPIDSYGAGVEMLGRSLDEQQSQSGSKGRTTSRSGAPPTSAPQAIPRAASPKPQPPPSTSPKSGGMMGAAKVAPTGISPKTGGGKGAPTGPFPPKGAGARAKQGEGKKEEKKEEKKEDKEDKEKKEDKESRAQAPQFDDPARRKKAAKQQLVALRLSAKQVPLFSHLPQWERPESVTLQARGEVHAAVVALGIKLARRTLTGTNARTQATLEALGAMLRDWRPPSEVQPKQDVLERVNKHVQFLSDCRPLGLAQGTAIKALKRAIGALPHGSEAALVRRELLGALDRWHETKLLGAADKLAAAGAERVRDGDVVLTVGCSSAVLGIVRTAWGQGRRFTVVVLDNGPGWEGRTTVRRLLGAGIPCTYALLSAVGHVLRGASPRSKVLVGAHALCSNGSVIARTGTAVLALMAQAAAVPVLVACETYKFHEKVQLDAITLNELQDPEALVQAAPPRARQTLAGWQEVGPLKVLALTYDITLAEHVSAIITELGLIPPTSVPVVLREAAQREADRA